MTRSYTLVVDLQTPTVNTATATGQGLNGPVGPVSDPALIEVNLQPDPVLEIVKTVVAAGDDCPSTFAEGVPGEVMSRADVRRAYLGESHAEA